jgi:hypothetical protein
LILNFFNKSENSIIDELEEAARLLGSVVRESDIEVAAFGAIGEELELSPSRGSRRGVAVLDTGEGDPEISCNALALLPLLARDAHVNNWLLDIAVLLV